MSIKLKSRYEIEKMRRANQVVRRVLDSLEEMIKPGVSTFDLNQRAIEITEEEKVRPAFLGYPSNSREAPPFPGVICASVNEEIVHGVPRKEPLNEGDIVSIDYGCELDGYYGDSAITVAVGEISEEAKKLLDVTEKSLSLAIEQCVVGNRLGDIANAVQGYVEENGFNVVREFVGHGIGTEMHEPPHVPNFGNAGQGRVLKEGLVLAIEPMVVVGSYGTKILADGWTAVTDDAGLAAHFEHTVAIVDGKPDILSKA